MANLAAPSALVSAVPIPVVDATEASALATWMTFLHKCLPADADVDKQDGKVPDNTSKLHGSHCARLSLLRQEKTTW